MTHEFNHETMSQITVEGRGLVAIDNLKFVRGNDVPFNVSSENPFGCELLNPVPNPNSEVAQFFFERRSAALGASKLEVTLRTSTRRPWTKLDITFEFEIYAALASEMSKVLRV